MNFTTSGKDASKEPSMVLGNPNAGRNLSAGQQIQHRSHQKSPHRQGIDYSGEGRHLHCRLRVRALV